MKIRDFSAFEQRWRQGCKNPRILPWRMNANYKHFTDFLLEKGMKEKVGNMGEKNEGENSLCNHAKKGAFLRRVKSRILFEYAQ
jgi:hypothetical protein